MTDKKMYCPKGHDAIKTRLGGIYDCRECPHPVEGIGRPYFAMDCTSEPPKKCHFVAFPESSGFGVGCIAWCITHKSELCQTVCDESLKSKHYWEMRNKRTCKQSLQDQDSVGGKSSPVDHIADASKKVEYCECEGSIQMGGAGISGVFTCIACGKPIKPQEQKPECAKCKEREEAIKKFRAICNTGKFYLEKGKCAYCDKPCEKDKNAHLECEQEAVEDMAEGYQCVRLDSKPEPSQHNCLDKVKTALWELQDRYLKLAAIDFNDLAKYGEGYLLVNFKKEQAAELFGMFQYFARILSEALDKELRGD